MVPKAGNSWEGTVPKAKWPFLEDVVAAMPMSRLCTEIPVRLQT